MGVSRQDAEELFELLPRPVQQSPAFHDRITGLWKYDFGAPIDIDSHIIIGGGGMFPLVRHLVTTMKIVRARLDAGQLQNLMKRLAIPLKHEDALAEFSPLFFAKDDTQATFEVKGLGVGNKTVDWYIQPTGTTPILLDVKNRVCDLIEGLRDLAKGSFTVVPPPQHDPRSLFIDTAEKYKPGSPTRQLQGAWIITELKQDRVRLQQAFESLDPERLHFAVLANWSQDAYVLVRDESNRSLITSAFGITHSDRWVFDVPQN
ncbi:MAG: hypothetical protein HYY59_05600 [Candidatus Omnitrophica bacterium]|nr:hypothetical protein [Candidatus Omnitrophota bacterium]